MRSVIYGAACSLDGFIARADGSLDWLLFTDDARALMAASWKRFDTILMGRKTYEVAASQGGGGGTGGIRTVVFSRTLRAPDAPGVELVREGAGAFVRALKREPGKDICVMGGGALGASLLGEDVVDEIGLNVHPILLGSGVPLFPDAGRPVDLERVECRPLAAGCVLLTYRVRHASSREREPAEGSARTA